MKNEITFLGLQTECGQSLRGLSLSPLYAIEYLTCYFRFRQLENLCLESQYLNGQSAKEQLSKEQSLLANAPEWQRRELWDFFQITYDQILKMRNESLLHVNWGGDHSVGIATVSAFRAAYDDGFVLWIDAHADLNVPQSSPTGNLHGMPLSFLLGLAEAPNSTGAKFVGTLPSDRLIYLGVRSLDPFEEQMLVKMGIRCYTMEMIAQRGIIHVMNEIARHIGSSPLHVSFDIDAVDPELAASTGVPVPAGLTKSAISNIAWTLARHCHVVSVDDVEINPLIGTSRQVRETFT